MNNIFNGKGVEVLLKYDDDFLKIKETLTRIGIASKKDKILFQSCHILHKKGRYIICHFKELFELDGKTSNLTDGDLARRNTIAALLEDWGLLTIVHPEIVTEPSMPVNYIKIIPFKDKKDWQLVAKYNIGSNKYKK